MTKFYDADVKKIARLSRIHIQQDKVESYATDLASMSEFMSQLSAIDTKGVETMTGGLDKVQRLREDLVKKENDCTAILQNAPEREDTFFVVPKVVE